MPFSVGKGTPKNIIIASIGVGGTPKAITNAWVGVGGVPKKFYTTDGGGGGGGGGGSLTASAAPSTLNGTTSNFGGSWIGATSQCAVTVAGETGTVAYQWNKVSGPTYIAATSQNSAQTVFEYDHTSNTPNSAVFECVVTDDSGSVTTNQVTVNFS